MCALCQLYDTNLHAAGPSDGSTGSPMLGAAAPTTSQVAATGNRNIDGLLSGFAWTGSVSYSFPNSASDFQAGYGDGEPTEGFSQLSVYEQSLVNSIMNQVGQYTNLTITYAGTESADITLGSLCQTRIRLPTLIILTDRFRAAIFGLARHTTIPCRALATTLPTFIFTKSDTPWGSSIALRLAALPTSLFRARMTRWNTRL